MTGKARPPAGPHRSAAALFKDQPVLAPAELNPLDSIGAIRLRDGDGRLVEFSFAGLQLHGGVDRTAGFVHQYDLGAVHLDAVLAWLQEGLAGLGGLGDREGVGFRAGE